MHKRKVIIKFRWRASRERMIVEMSDGCRDWAWLSKMVRERPIVNSFSWATECPGSWSIAFLNFFYESRLPSTVCLWRIPYISHQPSGISTIICSRDARHLNLIMTLCPCIKQIVCEYFYMCKFVMMKARRGQNVDDWQLILLNTGGHHHQAITVGSS